MINPRLLIKVFALILLLTGVFVLKSFLARSSLTVFFESMSFQPKTISTPVSSSVAAVSSRDVNQQSDEQFNLWLAQLQTSTAAVDQIAKAIYEKEIEPNLVALKVLLETDPQNSLVHYLLIQACLNQTDAIQCSKNSMLSLRTFESDNGVVRDLEFLSAYKKGDLSQALSALNEANHSPYTNDFTHAKFSALAQSMEKFGLKRDLQMVANIEGILEVGLANHLNSVASICKENQTQPEWKDACYARGQSLAERGRDGYSKMMGMSFMKSFGEVSDPAYLKLHNQFKEDLRAANQNSVLWETMAAKGWAPSDLQWKEFLTLYETQGDSAAKQYLENVMRKN